MHFSLTTIYVNNLEQSIQFYCNLIGLQLFERRSLGNQRELSMLGNIEQVKLELVYDPQKTDQRYQGFSIGFVVDSLKTATELLETNGYPLKRGPITPAPNVQFSFFTDPNGVEVQLLEYLKNEI